MKFWDTAGHLDSPVGVVDKSMVPAAERNAISDAGRAFVGPMGNMMNIAPAGRYRTARKRTPAIPNNHRAADRGRYRMAGAPDV